MLGHVLLGALPVARGERGDAGVVRARETRRDDGCGKRRGGVGVSAEEEGAVEEDTPPPLMFAAPSTPKRRGAAPVLEPVTGGMGGVKGEQRSR